MAKRSARKPPDVFIRDDGDVLGFEPLSPRAKAHFAWRGCPRSIPRGDAVEQIVELTSLGFDVRSGHSPSDGGTNSTDARQVMYVHFEQSMAVLTPGSPAARHWVDRHVQSESWQWQGGALVIDKRYVGQILQGAADDGFEIEER